MSAIYEEWLERVMEFNVTTPIHVVQVVDELEKMGRRVRTTKRGYWYNGQLIAGILKLVTRVDMSVQMVMPRKGPYLVTRIEGWPAGNEGTEKDLIQAFGRNPEPMLLEPSFPVMTLPVPPWRDGERHTPREAAKAWEEFVKQNPFDSPRG